MESVRIRVQCQPIPNEPIRQQLETAAAIDLHNPTCRITPSEVVVQGQTEFLDPDRLRDVVESVLVELGTRILQMVIQRLVHDSLGRALGAGGGALGGLALGSRDPFAAFLLALLGAAAGAALGDRVAGSRWQDVARCRLDDFGGLQPSYYP